MNKNYTKKTMNYIHKGYALYDSDLTPKNFIQSIQEIIKLHDVFKQTFKNRKAVVEEVEYAFEEIHCLDQIGLTDKLNKIKEKPLTQAAEFKLIYFHGNLRGFQYRFNGFLFDERSVKLVIAAIEKQYYKGKFKQSSTSYAKWLNENHQSFDLAFKSGKFQAVKKVLTLDESLTKRVREYMKTTDLTLMQFMTGVVGIYFKQGKHKDMMFSTDFFGEGSVIGNTAGKKSYQLKKNPNLLTHDFLKSDWQEKDKYSYIKMNLKDQYKDLKGSITTLPYEEVPFEIGFFIDEKDWEITLEIIAQKYRFKKDDLFLMLSKLRIIIFDILEANNKINEISLLTRKEEEIALSCVEPKVLKKTTSIYDQFIARSKEKASKPAFKDDKVVTFEKLVILVNKMKKTLEKTGIDKKMVNLNGLSDLEKLAGFIAIDGAHGVYSTESGYELKKGLLGYKISGTSENIKAQYKLKDTTISKSGYRNYCHFAKQYFSLTSDDVAPMDEMIKFGIPVLLAGGCVATDDSVTIKTQDVNDLKLSDTLKNVVVNDKFVEGKFNYNLHFGLSLEHTTPISFIGPIKFGRLEGLKPADGLGFVILNKYKQLTQAFEKGNVHVFGPCADINSTEDKITIGSREFKNVTSLENRASWFLDETLRF